MNQIMELSLEIEMVPNDAADVLRRALIDCDDVLRLAGASASLVDGTESESRVFGSSRDVLDRKRDRTAVGETMTREELAAIVVEWSTDLYDRMAEDDLRGEDRSLVVPFASATCGRSDGFLAIAASRPAILSLLAILTRRRIGA